MSKVSVLHHVRELEDDASEVKLVGVYSSKAKAEAAIARLATFQGFRDFPDGFEIEEHEVDDDRFWADGFVVGN